ncbi:hypothetical protein KRR26_00100 [Corallococcus sp. M34]|uniref:hypothetical protein n=1 Tax=Citreicoccus inhibens TaxID=2849499 RepID=UPI001C212513|nr:hypothetical protein [Citreicoccus inhibens]MBU8893978.1 hypothetical protein [Citreicoccus inhibens]
MTGTPLPGARAVSEQELWPRAEEAHRHSRGGLLRQELLLEATALEGFPEVLLQLPRLKKLWWWRFDTMPMNQVEALVSGMARLPALTHAGFLQGQLLALPGNLSRLARLEQFKLGLEHVPEPEVKRLRAALPPGRLHVGY